MIKKSIKNEKSGRVLKKIEKESKNMWNKATPFFGDMFEGEGSYQNDLILPNLERLLSPQKQDTLLDLCCGSGFFSYKFADKVGKIIGVDSASSLVENAKKRVPRGDFFVSDSSNLSMIKDASLDKIIIVLAIQNIEKVKETLAECFRVLRGGGSVFVVMNHPCFRIPKKSSWYFEEKRNTQSRLLDEYMSESKAEIEMKPREDNSLKTASYHRPLQFYFKIFEKVGFAVSRLEEWVSNRESEPGPRAIAENKARREFPLFMAIVMKKANFC